MSQNVFRKIQELGLKIKYQEDEEFAIKAKMIPALAFVPERNAIEAFELLQETLTSEFDDLLAYFEDTYSTWAYQEVSTRNAAIPSKSVEYVRTH